MSEAPTPNDAQEVVLDEHLLIGNSPALQDTLIEAAAEGGAVVINGGAVAQVHTPALQLLVSFIGQAENRGIPVDWSGVSPELQEVADLVGLSSALGIPPTHMTTLKD